MANKKANRKAPEKNKTDEPKRLKDGTVLGSHFEPGSARHETPPTHGGEQRSEYPRG